MRKIAIVRAINYLPFGGVLKSLADTPNLVIDKGSEFRSKIKDLLVSEGILKLNGFRSISEMIEEINRVIVDYLPYSSNYNSVILFSLNGLVPDDIEAGFANNTFSNRDIVVIDDLNYHLDHSDVVSIVATDTAIRGDVILSDDAVIMIRKERYDSLNEKEKSMLSCDGKINVKIFEGDLRTAVENTLLEMGYVPERPLLGKSHNGFEESATKQEIVDTIKSISVDRNIPMQYHFDYAFKNDSYKIDGVYNYFFILFYIYLQKRLKFSNSLLENLIDLPSSEYYLDLLMNEIKKYGINNYKELVQLYNQSLVQLKNDGILQSPEAIVNNFVDSYGNVALYDEGNLFGNYIRK